MGGLGFFLYVKEVLRAVDSSLSRTEGLRGSDSLLCSGVDSWSVLVMCFLFSPPEVPSQLSHPRTCSKSREWQKVLRRDLVECLVAVSLRLSLTYDFNSKSFLWCDSGPVGHGVGSTSRTSGSPVRVHLGARRKIVCETQRPWEVKGQVYCPRGRSSRARRRDPCRRTRPRHNKGEGVSADVYSPRPVRRV